MEKRFSVEFENRRGEWHPMNSVAGATEEEAIQWLIKRNGLTRECYRLKEIGDLPAFRIFLANGTDYVTSMAKGMTLADAKEYFLGKELTQRDEKTMVKVVKVEQI